MTISASPRRADYLGDGSTTEFPVPFQFFEISVYVNGALQTQGADYAISQEAPGLTGSIVFIAESGATPPNGSDVVILGATAMSQDVDYVNNDDFPAESHEGALDRLTMIVQEQEARRDLTVRAVQWHKPVSPLDFEENPETIIFVNALGDLVLRSAEQILGGVDIGDAIAAAAAAAISANAAEVSADDAAAAAVAAAASAVLAADATAILSTNPHFTGLPEFEGGLRIGKNGGGDSLVEFYDDNSNTWRSLWWDDDDNDWRVEDNSGSTRKLWHEGNTASQGEAEAGTENTKGMTALRVAQAIAALAGEGAFPAGTQLLCGNSTAPPGWTKLTDLNDYAIRLTSGIVGTSGSFAYSTVFASRTPTGVVNGTVLDVARIPSHSHSYTVRGSHATAGSDNGIFPQTWRVDAGANTGGAGGGGAHDHGFSGTPMPFNVYTRDVTMIEKT